MEHTYPEPTWCTPQDTTEGCSSLVATGPSPNVLTGVFVRLAQYHFSDPNNIQNENLKGYIWTNSPDGCISSGGSDGDSSSGTGSGSGSSGPDPCPEEDTFQEGSRILVGVSYQNDSINVQQRPAVYIKRETYSASRISFENKAQAGLNQDGVHEGSSYQVMLTGKHSLIAVGQTGAEADALGEEIFFRMLQYMPIIKEDMVLGHFLPERVSEIRELGEEAKKVFYSVVTLNWGYVYRWRIMAESPILKRIAFLYEDYQ